MGGPPSAIPHLHRCSRGHALVACEDVWGQRNPSGTQQTPVDHPSLHLHPQLRPQHFWHGGNCRGGQGSETTGLKGSARLFRCVRRVRPRGSPWHCERDPSLAANRWRKRSCAVSACHLCGASPASARKTGWLPRCPAAARRCPRENEAARAAWWPLPLRLCSLKAALAALAVADRSAMGHVDHGRQGGYQTDPDQHERPGGSSHVLLQHSLCKRHRWTPGHEHPSRWSASKAGCLLCFFWGRLHSAETAKIVAGHLHPERDPKNCSHSTSSWCSRAVPTWWNPSQCSDCDGPKPGRRHRPPSKQHAMPEGERTHHQIPILQQCGIVWHTPRKAKTWLAKCWSCSNTTCIQCFLHTIIFFPIRNAASKIHNFVPTGAWGH